MDLCSVEQYSPLVKHRIALSVLSKTKTANMNLTILIIIVTLKCCWSTNSSVESQIQDLEISDKILRNLMISLITNQDESERIVRSIGERLKAIGEPYREVPQIDYTICNSNKNYVGVLHDLKPEIVNFGLNFGARYCENGWTVIQRRGISGLDFDRKWEEYKKGFGSLSEDFWYGNDFIHALTYLHNLTLRVELETFEGEKGYAEYDTFKVESENDDYKLHIGGYSGNMGDSFISHNLQKFGTVDRGAESCGGHFKSGWWFYSCFMCNLNGIYYNTSQKDPKDWFGIIWRTWKEKVPSKKSKMMVRPK